MLGFTPIAGAPIASATPSLLSVAGTQTLGTVGQTAAISLAGVVTGAQTLGTVSQYTGTSYLAAGAQTLGSVANNNVVVRAVASISVSTASLEGVTNNGALKVATFVSGAQTLGAATQAADARVFWHLHGCGWISQAAGRAVDILLRHLPMGSAWITWRMPGKTAYRMILALADTYDRATSALCRLAEELDPRTTIDMIPEWETALGLPDTCLPSAATLAERRGLVILRLSHRRWTTASDWHQLAALFGLEIVITPGWWVQKPALYPNCYPKRYDLFPKLGRFRVYIDFKNVDFGGYDYGVDGRGPGYPVPYGMSQSNEMNAFMCLIDRIRPANVIVIWNERPSRYACVPESGI